MILEKAGVTRDWCAAMDMLLDMPDQPDPRLELRVRRFQIEQAELRRRLAIAEMQAGLAMVAQRRIV